MPTPWFPEPVNILWLYIKREFLQIWLRWQYLRWGDSLDYPAVLNSTIQTLKQRELILAAGGEMQQKRKEADRWGKKLWNRRRARAAITEFEDEGRWPWAKEYGHLKKLRTTLPTASKETGRSSVAQTPGIEVCRWMDSKRIWKWILS